MRHLTCALVLTVSLVGAPGAIAQVFPGTGVGSIPDGGASPVPNYGAPLVIIFAVTGVSRDLTSVAVDLNLTHPWAGDLDVALAAPGGAPSMILVSRIGAVTATGRGDSSNYGGTYNFSDGATGTNIWTVAAGPPTCNTNCIVTPGLYRTTAGGGAGQTNPAPVTSLNAAFGGLTPLEVNGTWTLTIRDAAAGFVGSVSAANLYIPDPSDLIFEDGFEA